jgi:hypothetical protein
VRNLSKSKLLAFRQCPKRLWLEIHRPELRADSAATEASFAIGHQVGDIARRIYDPDGTGALIDIGVLGFEGAFAKTRELLGSANPIFEAGFTADGALAFADILLPVKRKGKKFWRMVEVKSSTSVKDYHRDDSAIQAHIARATGVALDSIALAHIDSSWVYPGGDDYQGLLKENDLTEEAFGRGDEVKSWISDAQAIAAKRKEPVLAVGKQCWSPYECGFLGYCDSQEEKAEYPVSWLPRIQKKALKEHIDSNGVTDMREVPDELLNDKQLRVKQHTLTGKTFFDAAQAAAELAACPLPACFLDFETIQFAVPIWAGTRPYQQIPFQFSTHSLSKSGKLAHREFLDLSGNDPSLGLAQALVDACDTEGPVFAYNASFEMMCIRDLGERFPKLKPALMAIHDRVVDLLPIAERNYYHPSQEGSWSIKKVLPAIAPELRYDALDGVQDGGMAQDAFLETIFAETPAGRKSDLERQLLDYCKLDTYAMVRMWQIFAGRSDLSL